MAVKITELEERVANNVLNRNMEAETWQKAVGINGLLKTKEERFVQGAKNLIDRSVETQTSRGALSLGALDPTVLDTPEWPDYKSGYFQCSPATLGYSVLDQYEMSGNEKYLQAAEKQYNHLISAKRTADGGISYNTIVNELWIDALYMVSPFLARYGEVTNNHRAFQEAVNQILIHKKYLWDENTQLFRHIWRETPNTYPESSLWSRGNGWAAAGIIDTLIHLPDDVKNYEKVVDTLVELLESIIGFQDSSGLWHHILDDPASSLETSGTLMFIYAINMSLDGEYTNGNNYLKASKKALKASKGFVDDLGNVNRVALPPGGPGVPLGNTSYGQGWFLLASASDRLLE
ncbi:glycoside hydrolase family 88 protein [Natrononativus amylolyticus]|uniref:glycoside hydrolase family 88 protein n=1 Tax=Natrononativus amylolyticus TaxID=2963434 RepID=UPI0020CD95A9|nr:glycoside hydrolase family 88 protein [Natrononativus amylolyticus]